MRLFVKKLTEASPSRLTMTVLDITVAAKSDRRSESEMSYIGHTYLHTDKVIYRNNRFRPKNITVLLYDQELGRQSHCWPSLWHTSTPIQHISQNSFIAPGKTQLDYCSRLHTTGLLLQVKHNRFIAPGKKQLVYCSRLHTKLVYRSR